jgi:hypothetical protein
MVRGICPAYLRLYCCKNTGPYLWVMLLAIEAKEKEAPHSHRTQRQQKHDSIASKARAKYIPSVINKGSKKGSTQNDLEQRWGAKSD